MIKLEELEKRWHENYAGVEKEPLDLMISLEIFRDPEENTFGVFISEPSSSGYERKISTTDDIVTALADYLETQI